MRLDQSRKNPQLKLTGLLASALLCVFLAGCSLIFPGPPDHADLVGTWTYDPEVSTWHDDDASGTLELYADGTLTMTDVPAGLFYSTYKGKKLTFTGQWDTVPRVTGVDLPHLDMWDPNETANLLIAGRPLHGPSLVIGRQGDRIILMKWVGDPDNDIRYILTKTE